MRAADALRRTPGWLLSRWLLWAGLASLMLLALPLRAQTSAASSTPPPLAAWQALPAQAADVAAGPRGEAAAVDAAGVVWRRDATTGAWSNVGGGMARVAIDNDGVVWAIDNQGRVNRLEGTQWRAESLTGADIAATPDGGVIVATLDAQLARYDKARRSWSNTPGSATRVAVDGKGVIWIVGADGAVLRGLGGPDAAWIGVTAQASDITADASGRVLISGLDNRAYEWVEATARWEPLAQATSSVAVALGAGRLWRVEPDGRVSAEGMPEQPTPGGQQPPPPGARPGVPTRWVKLDAPAVQVAVASNADVYALDNSGSVWRLNAADVRAERFGNWARQSGNFTRLRATLDGRLWGIDRQGALWALQGSQWRQAADGVRDLAATPDGTVWLLLANGQLVALAGGAALNPLPPAAAGAAQTLHADEHGLPWTTHAGGRVERFDGARWVSAAQSPQPVASLAIGAEGSVYGVSPQGALGRRDALSAGWIAHPTPTTTPITSVAVGPDGLPWIVTTRGEFFAERPLAATTTEQPLPSVFTRLLTWRAAGGGPVARVSVAADGGVMALGADGAVWRWRGSTNWGTVSGRLAALAAAPNGAAWGLDPTGRVLQLRGGFWTELPSPGAGSTRLIATGPNGSLWTLQGDEQIVRWDEPSRRWVLVTRALAQATALAVGPDAETWLIDARGGVQRLRGTQWAPVPGIVATSISVGPDGTVYATAADQGIHWLDRRDMGWKPATGRALQVAVGPAGAPWAVFADNRVMASGRFLDEQARRDDAAKPAVQPPTPPVVVTPNVPPSTTAPLSYQALASDQRVRDLGIGADGSVFAIGSDGGLQCFSNADRRFTVASMGQHQRVTVTPDGSPWVLATSGAVSRFDKGSWRSVPEFSARDIASGPDGVLWAVGADGISYRYAPNTDRFEAMPVQRSDSPVKGRRIAGANGGVHWVAAESNTLFECRNGDCATRLIGVADVAVAPDNTVFVVDLLGNLQRYNPLKRAFERANGSGVSLAVGPGGLPWLVAADGRVTYAGLFATGSRSVNTAQCAARFAGTTVPQGPVVGTLITAADDALVVQTGLSASVALLLENDRLNGARPANSDVSLSLESPDGMLRIEGEVLQVNRGAPVGAVLGATYRVCSRALVNTCAAARVSVTVTAVPPPPTAPGAPTAVSALAGAAGSGQAQVSFAPPASNGGSVITRYTVTSSPDGLSATGSNSPITLGGLRTGVSYTFVVNASNAVGTGASSVPSNAVTLLAAATVPGAPTGVAAQAGNAQATVSFAAPASDGGSVITSYTVTSSPGGLVVTGTASPIVVSGLGNGTAYTFSVSARNALGSGPASAPSAPVTPAAASVAPGAPTAVTASAGNARAVVSFMPPASNGGSAITGYTVRSSPDGISASGSASPITVGGLRNGVAYTFTVVASNALGVGAASLASSAVTPLAPPVEPGSPTGVVAVAGNAQAVVSFTAPASDGGSPISGYTVTSSPGGFNASATASPITVSGLANGTAYRFTVVARNAVGSGPASQASAAVIPAVPTTVPGAPTAVTAVAGNAQASVSFSVPASEGGRPITGYTVRSNPDGLVASGNASPIVVGGLSNGVAYSFSVTASNANGAGAASAVSAAVTPSTTPGAPTAVLASPGNAQASVSFTAPNDGGRAITGYLVTASPGGYSASGTASPIVVSGLANGTAYRFSVVARNGNGDGPPSAASPLVTPATVPDAPSAVLASAGNSQASVRFNVPARDGGSAIVDYIVSASPGGATATATASPIVVSGLTNGTAYTFSVRARNAVGSGPASVASPAITPSSVPGVPGAVVGSAGNGQASVSFTPPADTGGSAITRYTVTASPGGASAIGTTSPIVVSGLANGTAYSFSVTASNANGTGLPSAASTAVTPSTTPGAPTTVVATAGNRQVSVSFAVPASSGGSVITGYTVSASPGGATASGSASPIVVSGLNNGTAYTFTVRASNANGSGPASAASPRATPASVPGVPTSVTASASNGAASVSFSAPADNGGSTITRYTVTASPGGATATGTASPIFVGALNNGTAYTFSVTASNANGSSLASAPSAAVTPAGTPAAPLAVVATPGNAQASVAFAAPNDGGTPITQYTVTASPGGATATGTASPIVLTGLSNGVAYRFTVQARNLAGAGPPSTPSAAVTPSTVPGAPTAVVATRGNAQVSVSFAAPADIGGSSVTGYTVSASPGGSSASGTASPIVVSGLANGTAYTFSVRAVNANGSGAASASSAAVTPATTPGAPTAVSASLSDNRGLVSFTAPLDNGGDAITQYTVTVSPGGGTVSGTASPITVNDLVYGTTYTFTVQAINAVGVGPASTGSLPLTPTTVPGAPTAVVAAPGDEKATVSFAAPDNGGRPITRYTVTVSPGGGTVSGTASPIVVTGLNNGTAYTFTVKATNGDGIGPASAPSAAVTPATTPLAPTSVVATPGDAQASVAFAAPVDNGGAAVQQYTVTASPGGATASGAASPILVTGLTNGTAYTFTVRATNVMGNGPVSTASAAVTPAAVPSAPTAVSAVAGVGSASVSFTAPTSNGGAPITGYTVTASPGGLSASGTASPIVVTGLAAGTAYTFTVQANNAAGASAASAPSAPVTTPAVPGAPTAVSAVAGAGQATVSFTAPGNDGGTAIMSYLVTASPGGQTASGTASPITVSGLANGTPYTFTVQATNAVGAGLASGPSASVTPLGVPEPPTAVSAVAGIRQATVSFTAPTSTGGSPITGYTVTASPGGQSANGTASPIVVSGLANGTSYTFTVRATSAAGTGNPSAASSAVSTVALPGAPSVVGVVAGLGQATLSFTAPADNGGSPITNYTVTAIPSTPVTPGAAAPTVTGTASPIVVTGLTPFQTYTFTIAAVNAAGTGASAASSSATPNATPGAVSILGWGIVNPDTRTIDVYINYADPGPPQPPTPDRPPIISYTIQGINRAAEDVLLVTTSSVGVTQLLTTTGRANNLRLTLPESMSACDIHRGSEGLRLIIQANNVAGPGDNPSFTLGPALVGSDQCVGNHGPQ